jgi:hypothetical protein
MIGVAWEENAAANASMLCFYIISMLGAGALGC